MEWLFAEGNRFDFFQAVRLLEILYSPEKSAQDEGVELDTKAMIPRPSKSGATSPSTVPDSEKVEDFVRFKSAVGLNFPTSDISQVRLKEYPQDYPPDDPPKLSLEELQQSPPITPENTPITEMTVNLMGLAGALGPLDMPTTELIIERAANKDKALKDFLDIFNHRLISLLYRIRKIHRIGLEDEPPGQDKISKYLFSIIGLGTDGLMGRMMVRDRSLLHYAGLLSQQPRSIVGLERILSDYFKVKVKGHQFVGGWYDLDESQWTKIGEKSGQNNVLGKGAVVVGKRVWDQQAKIEIHLGPLTYQQFPSFIPTGWGYRALCDLTRFYLGDTLDVSFRLILKGEEIPLPVLGMINEPVLGWTSWLTSHPDMSRAPWVSSSRPPWLKALPSRLSITRKDDSQVVLQLRVLPSEFKSEKLPHFFNLPPAQLDELIRRMKVRIYTRFETIINQGDDGDSMFAIRSGSVRVTRREENGKETTLPGLGPKECFGEMSLLLGKNREVTVIALERCEILELSRSDFDKFAALHPRWSKTLKAYRYGQFVKQQG
jgi:type VI secretion system protein ImpH